MKKPGKRAAQSDQWRVEARETFIAIARAVRKLANDGQEIPFSLIAAAKTFGGTNIEAGALLGEEDEAEGKKS